MFIQSEDTQDPNTLRFLPGRPVLESGTIEFPDAEAAARSPLAVRLFDVEGVETVTLEPTAVRVTKDAAVSWPAVKAQVLAAIMDHFTAGDPVLADEGGAGAASPAAQAATTGDAGGGGADGPGRVKDPSEYTETEARIAELLDTRIRPVLAGRVEFAFAGFDDGAVRVQTQGSPGMLAAMKQSIETMLKHYVPEIESFVIERAGIDPEAAKAQGREGLFTEKGRKVQEIIEQNINPAVASHGGWVDLIDVKDETVYVELGGGCQGCGMANVTLKQGIERMIVEQVPNIQAVLDVTDHASGDNPYYQPSAK